MPSNNATIGPELKPGRRQKDWLTPELLHSAPKAHFCASRDAHPAAQLEHPLGGPLCVVISPVKNAVGVTRINGKWHWQVAA